jgi:hypothetical protein
MRDANPNIQVNERNNRVTDINEWTTAHKAWDTFVHEHPELGYQPGRWQLHNFLRHFRADLTSCDAIRKAKGRHWIAHQRRFNAAAFDCATGALNRLRSTPELAQ